MTPSIGGLENVIKRNKAKLARVDAFDKLARTVAWKRLVTEGFMQTVADSAMKELVHADKAVRDEGYAKLHGIAVFKNYLDKVQEDEVSAGIAIDAANSELSRIRGSKFHA